MDRLVIDIEGIWDTHVHVLDPIRFPYRIDRSYTPSSAHPIELLKSSPATNFLVVQASIEDGHAGILEHMEQLQQDHLDRIIRGAIIFENLAPTAPDYERLHKAGVRCLRVRIPGSHSDALVETVKSHLTGTLGQTARQRGWAVSMQLPLLSWAALADHIEQRNFDIPIIAEHCAGIKLPLTGEDIPAFEVLLRLLRSKRIFVKLGALHRRIPPGASIKSMEQCIRDMAEAGPNQILWGSDWPHVDASSTRSTSPSLHLNIDAGAELEQLRAWLPDGVVRSMLCSTPNELFGT